MSDDPAKVFCIDSSTFITLNRIYSLGLLPDNLWDLLDDLFVAGRIISHSFVFSEICPKTTKPDFLAKWIKNKEQYFYPVTERQTQLVWQILAKFPELISYAKEIDEADPWLISLAIEKKEFPDLFDPYSNITIVSNESVISGTKIPAVCKEFNVPHMNIQEFFNENGWRVILEK